MSAREKVIGVMIKKKNHDSGRRTFEVCREISVKEICEDCERTALYLEENCGQPTVYAVCEEIPVIKGPKVP